MSSKFSVFAFSWRQTIPGITLFKQPLKQVPKLPANKQLEVVFWVIADVESLSPSLPQSSVSSIEAMVDNHGDWPRRRAVVQTIHDLRLRLQNIYGEFSDATQMLRDDRGR